MNLRVDLLKPDERREQGVVSRAFLIKAGVVVLAAVVVTAVSALLMHQAGRQHELLQLQERWRKAEPLYREVLRMQQETAAARQLMAELASWQKSRIDWAQPLQELQQLVPPIIQLKSLGILGVRELRQPPPPPAATADSKPPPPPPPKEFRRFTLKLDGRASGELAEDTVVAFVRALRLAPAFQPVLESIKLQSLQREVTPAERGGKADRLFTIEGLSFPREIK